MPIAQLKDLSLSSGIDASVTSESLFPHPEMDCRRISETIGETLLFFKHCAHLCPCIHSSAIWATWQILRPQRTRCLPLQPQASLHASTTAVTSLTPSAVTATAMQNSATAATGVTEVDRIKSSLNTLSASDIQAVKRHIIELEHRQIELDQIKQTLDGLPTDQLQAVKKFLRRSHNQRSLLLRLPPELREMIFDFATLGELRGWTPPHPTHGTLGSVRFSLASMCKFKNACSQLRSECKDMFGRLTKLGMIAEHHKTAGWQRLSPDDFGSMKNIQLWRVHLASISDARGTAERYDRRMQGYKGWTYGIMYFTAVVDVPPRIYAIDPA